MRIKSSSAEFPVSDTDKTDKTPCSAPEIRFEISVPGVLSEGLGYNDIVSSAVVDSADK